MDFVVCNGGKAQRGELAMSLRPSKLVNIKTGQKVAAESLCNTVAMAGIGNPQRFFNTLSGMGVTPVHCEPFADHKAFELPQLEGLAKKGDHLLMTEKDAVKCRGFVQQNPNIENWWYLPVDAHFSNEAATQIMNTILKVKDGYGSPTA